MPVHFACLFAEHGDQPGFVLPKEALDELKQAKGPVYSTADSPWWDWDEGKQVRGAGWVCEEQPGLCAAAWAQSRCRYVSQSGSQVRAMRSKQTTMPSACE